MSRPHAVVAATPDQPYQLSEHLKQRIDFWTAKFPPDRRQSAVIAALREAQHDNGGHITRPIQDAVADYLEIPRIAVYEVATFYSMLELKPVGRHSISVCTNVSCMLCGGVELREYIQSKLGIGLNESTPDGKFYLKEDEECLGACAAAPMMQIDHVYYENLTPEKVDEILDNLE